MKAIMMRWVLLSMSLLQTTGSTPEAFVTQFYTVYIRHHSSGFFLQGAARRTLYPLLSTRLRTVLDDAAACQKDWLRQQPKGSTDKPPFVECCLFASMPEGMPTSFTIGSTKPLRNGAYQIVVDFVRKESNDLIKGRDAVIVIKEGDRFLLDDVVGDVDDRAPGDTDRLSTGFKECRNRRWIGRR